MTTEAPTEQAATWRRVLRSMDSPLRVRFHLLIAIGLVLTVLALWFEGTSKVGVVRAQERLDYQSSATAAATIINARLAAAGARIDAADDLISHGHGLEDLCDAMGPARGREYQRLRVYNAEGELRCFTTPGTSEEPRIVRVQPYFQAALTTGGDQVAGPMVETSSGRLSVLLAHPIRSGRQPIGVAIAAIDAGVLFDRGQRISGVERELVSGPEGGWFEVGSLAATSPPFGVTRLVSRSAADQPCPVTIVGEAAWTCSLLPGSGLLLATAHPEAQVFRDSLADMSHLRYRILGVIAMAILAALLGDFLFLRRIRLAYGRTGLSRLGAGDTARHDEIDSLGSWARGTEALIRGLRSELDAYQRRQRNSEYDLLTSIAETVETRYPFLRNHGDRVGRYARQIGARMGFGEHDLELLEFAARVHDLGKIAIADAVYLKPGRLEPIELAQMQLHASRGGEIAGRMRNVPPEVAEAIRHHHERWDGSGYPDGLAGTAIPLWSRVIAVADAYDAMTEERPYRQQPLTHDEAVEILSEGAGVQWDATAVQAFFEVLDLGSVQPKLVSVAVRRVAGNS